MAIQILSCAEIDKVSGGAITVGGPGLAASVDPFALAAAVLTNTFSLAGSAIDSVAGLIGTLTGLVGSLSGLIGTPSLSASVSVSASASVRS